MPEGDAETLKGPEHCCTKKRVCRFLLLPKKVNPRKPITFNLVLKSYQSNFSVMRFLPEVLSLGYLCFTPKQIF